VGTEVAARRLGRRDSCIRIRIRPTQLQHPIAPPHIMAPRPNLTGFDPQKFAAASGQPRNDPWAR